MKRISWAGNGTAFETLLLGSLGFSAKFIGGKTRLSNGQVYYRLKKGDVHIKDYRDGKGPGAQQVMLSARAPVASRLRHKADRKGLK